MKILFSTLLIFLLMSCGGGEMHRSPAPGFGFTSRRMRINEDSDGIQDVQSIAYR